MEPIEVVIARSELDQLVNRYAVAVDRRDTSALADLFWPGPGDGEADEYRRLIRSDFDASLSRVGISFMNVGTHVVDLQSPDRASGFTYCRSEFALDGRWTHHAILYRDEYIRIEKAWYFYGRRGHELFYGAHHGDDPLSLARVYERRERLGLGSAPGSWADWSAFWRRVAVPIEDGERGLGPH